MQNNALKFGRLKSMKVKIDYFMGPMKIILSENF